MMKVYVVFKDWETGVSQNIDQIEIEEGYTPEDYLRDCESNGNDMSGYRKESVDVWFEDIEQEDYFEEGTDQDFDRYAVEVQNGSGYYNAAGKFVWYREVN